MTIGTYDIRMPFIIVIIYIEEIINYTKDKVYYNTNINNYYKVIIIVYDVYNYNIIG